MPMIWPGPEDKSSTDDPGVRADDDRLGPAVRDELEKNRIKQQVRRDRAARKKSK